jgi:hypothetical protein
MDQRTSRTILIGSLGAIGAVIAVAGCNTAPARDERSYQAGYNSSEAIRDVKEGVSEDGACNDGLYWADIALDSSRW